ncbi:MAG: aminoacyl-tRNA deacylase [Desulfuromonadaceae bacterium]|nr:aminoacyl-tRNA deacylase [Desulfuromonadaceae bacterium]MDD2854575.1 aminoacyl-tRNA deacylase [Desulfuromonadaceae bacterium]
MAKEKTPVTAAVRQLRAENTIFSDHIYAYEDKGGTAASSRQLGFDEHSVIKTLIMEDENHRALIVLMHGDLQVSTKELARELGVKQISPCPPETAQKYSGYMVGGTSPFGTRQKMPVYMEESITELQKIYINGGKRGYLVGLAPDELMRILKPRLVNVGIR